MLCPHDKSALALHDTEGHIGFRCPSCAGVWLPPKYVESIGRLRTFSYAAFVALLKRESNGAADLVCPSGCGHLEKSRHLELALALAWCPICLGVWFEQGQLGRLLAQLPRSELLGVAGLFMSPDRLKGTN